MSTVVKQFEASDEKLKDLIEDFFLILSQTEKKVITKRFSLDDQPKQTLEKIGQHFDVTRERIRQIENNALKKLQRNVMNSHIRNITDVARSILQENGGVLVSDSLISKVLVALHSDTSYTANVIRFAIRLDKEVSEVRRDKYFAPIYHFTAIKFPQITKTYKVVKKRLQDNKDVMSFAAIYKDIKDDIEVSKMTMESVAKSAINILVVDEGYIGLSKWRHINPKSIKDKAILIFQKLKKPLHFVELANKISEFGKSQKHVTVQAVHNDLIRYKDFVLVGRGVYALTKWGIPAGTVMDIIAKVLKEKGPLKRREIIEEVEKLRDVKENTISLNLQKSPAFIRVGRAVYDFDESKWEEPEGGRGRAYLKKEKK
ncbi:TPA: hypothetical protein EYG84_00595 [Candidatus Gracilibacteria bacterium]|nr:hypothetical protein [Candidatus Gracilibacteria bacterium]